MAYAPEEREQAMIYALCDPRDGRVRYIGKAKDVDKRLKGHLREIRRRSPLYSWIASLKKLDLKPVCKVLEVCCGDWRDDEKRLIAKYREECSDLLNLADGGDEPLCPLEVRRENGRKVSKAIHSDPLRKEVWRLNQFMASEHKRGRLEERHLVSLRLAAAKAPHLFGMWANV
jgi:hypothetical protein